MRKEQVAIVRVEEQRLDRALQEMIALLGGLEEAVPRGSRVLVKPNFTFAPTHCGITHPEVVEGVVRLLAEASPRQIVIAEGSGDTYTPQSFRFQGVYRIADRYGAEVVDLNLEEGIRAPIPEGLGREYVVVPQAVIESDVLVSIPIFKLWGSSPLSLCLKNLIGLYGGRYYGYNKDSDTGAREDPFYGLAGEVGTELGAHKPTLADAICAMNSAVPTHLAIIDALEGSDGGGHYLRMDTLIGGRNPVATDTVGLAVAGLRADEHRTFSLCAERGLGPCRLEEIAVKGRSVEEVAFSLERLRDNVLELPVRRCLELLSTGELHQIHRAFGLYGIREETTSTPESREGLLAVLGDVLESAGSFERILDQCDQQALNLLELLIAEGGTSGDVESLRTAFGELHGGGPYKNFAPTARLLGRLGLAYPVEGACYSYYVLPEGIVAAYQSRCGPSRSRPPS